MFLSSAFLLGASTQILGAQRVTRSAGVFFTRLFFTLVSSRFSSADQGLNRGAIWLRLPLASPVSFHVLWISLLRPGLLAVSAQRAVKRILLQLLAVVIGAAATLAVAGAADHLVRMAAQWLELLAAVRAFPDFEISWAHDCITSGAITVQPGQQTRKSSNSRGY